MYVFASHRNLDFDNMPCMNKVFCRRRMVVDGLDDLYNVINQLAKVTQQASQAGIGIEQESGLQEIG